MCLQCGNCAKEHPYDMDSAIDLAIEFNSKTK